MTNSKDSDMTEVDANRIAELERELAGARAVIEVQRRKLIEAGERACLDTMPCERLINMASAQAAAAKRAATAEAALTLREAEPVAWVDGKQLAIVREDGRTAPNVTLWAKGYADEHVPLYTHPASGSAPEGWRDIATALKDGTPALYCDHNGVVRVGRWWGGLVADMDGDWMGIEFSKLTHWQPLPKPPATTRGGEG